ncbi:NADH-quinone oxidoreductase subunit L, partial [Lactobacillus delbrueckii subsp. bulgaricus]|nr:NADH-quinone oxidoreductase subunit L [Lactobacillus delbrueckii subsp. bulgaricus]
VAGYINTPWFGTFLGDWLTKDVAFKVREGHGPVWIMIVATLVSLTGIALAYVIYGKKSISRDWAGGEDSPLYKLLKEKYYVDELYNMTVLPITKGIAHVLRLFEVYVVE